MLGSSAAGVTFDEERIPKQELKQSLGTSSAGAASMNFKVAQYARLSEGADPMGCLQSRTQQIAVA